METPTRATLLKRVRDPADRTAWNEFDAIYRPLLQRYATLRGLRPADVEDVVQDCLTKLQQRLPTFEYDPTRGRFKGLLKTIVRNRCANFVRDRRDRPAADAVLDAQPATDDPPDELFEKVWLQEHLRHCLEQVRAEIDTGVFEAFRDYVLEEQSVEDVCRRWKMSAQQVYKLKWEVTQRLKRKMADLLGEEPGEPRAAPPSPQTDAVDAARPPPERPA